MKKTTLFAMTLASVNVMAWEVNVTTGYEPVRTHKFYANDNGTVKFNNSNI